MAEKLLKETKDTQTKRKKAKKVAKEEDIYKIDLTLESPENEDDFKAKDLESEEKEEKTKAKRGRKSKNVVKVVEDEEEVDEIFGNINKWINEDLEVSVKEMSKEEAVQIGAEHSFIDRYPDIVTVYSIGNVSKELCGGPHVNNTNELGHFKIVKEEASSAGVRRIKAILE